MYGFNPCDPNAFAMNVMQSSSDADLVIKLFIENVRAGMDTQSAYTEALTSVGVPFSDFISYDQRRIKTAVYDVLSTRGY